MRKTFMKLVVILIVYLLGIMPIAAQWEHWNKHLGIGLLNKSGQWQRSEFEYAMYRRNRFQFSGSKGLRTINPRGYSVLGFPVHEIRANYDSRNFLTVIDIVFVNKGDDSNVKRLRKVIRSTARALEKKLTRAGGQPVKAHYGHRKLHNNAQKWSCGKVDLVLEYVSNEYVMLHIVFPGRNKSPDKKKDFTAKNRDFSENVVRTSFGDSYIKNIPMVNQGNKGYCVPATVERVLKYYGINNINMHQLADAGNTRKGGGTRPKLMFSSITSACRRSGLKMSKEGEVRMRMIKKNIDRGIPVFWCMNSNKEYEMLRLLNRSVRRQAPSAEAWSKQINKHRVPKHGTAHMCLIIGYNERTGEIAVSNSWGDHEIAPSWVPLKIALTVSRGYTVVLLPR